MRSALSLALLLAVPAAAQQAQAPTPYQRAIAAGYKALTLCEGLFSAGRTQAQVEAVELHGIYPEYDAIVPTLPVQVDRGWRRVAVAFGSELPPRRAEHNPGVGCTLEPIGATEATAAPALHPHPLIPGPVDPRPWPQGDGEVAPRPSQALAVAVGRAFDQASYGEGSRTTGVVVLRDGRITAERYADGFGPLVANRTWSVAKSIAGTLIGLGAAQAGMDPNRPAQIPEWSAPNDPRRTITLDQLLRMTSGLHSDTAGNRTDGIYFGGTAVTEQAVAWPLEVKPGTRFRYANNDTLLAVRALRAALNDDRYRQFPRDALFFPLGMQHTTTGMDWRGNFVLSSQVWSTARDLARLGQFWLQDGVWLGKRLLPEGWMRYMTTPSGRQPADGPGYGATLWLFGPEQGLPEGSYAAQGNRGQYVMVVPSERLVVVRRGEDPGGARFDIAKFTADVIAAAR